MQRLKKILITGGTGFFGYNLIRKISSRNELILLHKNELPKQALPIIKEKHIKTVKCDLASDFSILKNQGKIDLLIHMAAIMPSHCRVYDEPLETFTTNLFGTVRLVNSLHVSKICYISSVDVYGESRELIKENSLKNPDSNYGISKLAAEDFLRIHAHKNKCKLVILRCSHAYGPNEHIHKAVPSFIKCALLNQRPIIYGKGEDLRDYVYIDDVINAILLSFDREGIFNVCSGENISMLELAKTIYKLMRKKFNPQYKARKRKPLRNVYSNEKARKKLQFRPKIGLECGLRREIDWLKGRYNSL